MFETPTLITMTIAATRMHRSLIDFASKTSEVYDSPLHSFFPAQCGRCRFRVHEDPQLDSSIVILKPKRSLKRSLGRSDTGPTALEVAVHTVFEQHPTDLVSNDDSSATSISEYPSNRWLLIKAESHSTARRFSNTFSGGTSRLTLPGDD